MSRMGDYFLGGKECVYIQEIERIFCVPEKSTTEDWKTHTLLGIRSSVCCLGCLRTNNIVQVRHVKGTENDIAEHFHTSTVL